MVTGHASSDIENVDGGVDVDATIVQCVLQREFALYSSKRVGVTSGIGVPGESEARVATQTQG
jgi:hypothetical protein